MQFFDVEECQLALISKCNLTGMTAVLQTSGFHALQAALALCSCCSFDAA